MRMGLLRGLPRQGKVSFTTCCTWLLMCRRHCVVMMTSSLLHIIIRAILSLAIGFHVHLSFHYITRRLTSFMLLKKYITFHQLNILINGDHQFQSRTMKTNNKTIKTIKSHPCLPALQGHSYSNHPNKPPSRQNRSLLTTPIIPITHIRQNQPPWGPIHIALRPIPMLRRWRQAMAASGTLL